MLTLNVQNEKISYPNPVVMGILNVTPDSFSDGGRFYQIDNALKHCEEMLSDGAEIIDIGGCSTRPNNEIANETEEMQRVIPIVKEIRKRFPKAVLSIDTFRKSVAENCIKEGADIINDISGGLFDAEMLPYIGKNHIPYILMHCVGTPETIHQYALDGNIHQTVNDFFACQCKILESYGDQQIILDPGIGFGKSLESNYALLGHMDEYRYKGLPILIGISRKSMIWKVLETNYKSSPETVENGTTVLNTLALINGADIIRVHDVKKAVETVKLVSKLC